LKTPFILGIDESVPGSAYLSTDRLYDLVGHNTGNLAFHHAVSNILGGQLPAVSWYAEPAAINARGDIGVLPCANQLGPHVNYQAIGDSFQHIDRPLVSIGLGAQGSAKYADIPEVPEGTLKWVRAIAERSPAGKPNISVRGDFTLKVLDHYGLADRAVVLGCPTLFLNPDPELGRKVQARAEAQPFDRIAIAGGHQNWAHLSRLEQSLTRLMAATDGVYVVQSPKEMVVIGRGEADRLSDAALGYLRDYTAPELTIVEYKRWANRYARAFFDIPAWMEYLRRFDFVVGPRIHGVMLGIQAGVPSLCLAHDSRTREMCETMQVPFVMAQDHAGGVTREKLRELFQFDGEAFDANRRTIGARFGRFLRDNELNPSPVFGPLFEASAPAPAPVLMPISV
jgi:hypothetical protein